MIIVLRRDCTERQVEEAIRHLAQHDISSQPIKTGTRILLVLPEDSSTRASHIFTQIPHADKIIRLNPQYSLAAQPGCLAVNFNGVSIKAGGPPVIIGGPCSVEGRNQLLTLVSKVKEAGASMLRGGAFKPRTSPYDFQGLGLDGLKFLAEARLQSGLPVVSEIMSTEQIEIAEPYIDMLQIGARNMYNYELLKECGQSSKPVLLKRGISATVHEFLNAAEYIILSGNPNVVLCERGIRTFETTTRNTLDLCSVAALKSMTHLPVLVDPSHGTGRADLVRPLSRAAIACGADGLLIEVHDQPSQALSDGTQAITPSQLREIVDEVTAIFAVLHVTSKMEVLPALGSTPVAVR